MSHPFSVANITNSGIGFLIQPSNSDCWTDHVLELMDESDTITVSVILDGPYGLVPFEYRRLNALVVIVGGSGITTVFPCIADAAKQGIPCHLYWSVRDYSYTQLSYFQTLLSIDQVTISVFVTGHLDLEALPTPISYSGLDIHQERMMPKRIMADLMLAYGNSIVGLYTCGPRMLMDSVEEASSTFDNVILYRVSYEW